MGSTKHTLLVLNPGHFHAALTLRRSHPRLSDDVYVYAEDGPDVERFLSIVRTFNERGQDATRWKLHVYRGTDYLERLRAERTGDVVIVAGKNEAKMRSIQQLHADGYCVLGDKPWLIRADETAMLGPTTAAAPLAMDIMTERHEIVTRVQRALMAQREVFGHARANDGKPALHFKSVHHLYKIVNQRPLIRPAWYFDVAVQGEGITDVTTHLVDLAQWMTEGVQPFDYERDVELLSARQWPTDVPRDLFSRITGLDDFPDALRDRVTGGCLRYLCNAEIGYRLRRIPVSIESQWDLAIPEGGGDTHYALARGTRADLIVEQNASTRFATELSVHPVDRSAQRARALTDAVARLQGEFPGLGVEPAGTAFRITIPQRLRTTHEEHFAAVLDEFLARIDSGAWPANLGPDLVTKYTLLARAAELSHRGV